MLSMSGFQFLDPSIRLVFSLAIGMSVFNLLLGFIQVPVGTTRPGPAACMFVPGILGGWVLKTCFFLLIAPTRLDAQFQSTQLVYAAVAQGLAAVVLVNWRVFVPVAETHPKHA